MKYWSKTSFEGQVNSVLPFVCDERCPSSSFNFDILCGSDGSGGCCCCCCFSSKYRIALTTVVSCVGVVFNFDGIFAKFRYSISDESDDLILIPSFDNRWDGLAFIVVVLSLHFSQIKCVFSP